MLNFNTLLEKEYKSAYESAYDLSLKKLFSNPDNYLHNFDNFVFGSIGGFDFLRNTIANVS